MILLQSKEHQFYPSVDKVAFGYEEWITSELPHLTTDTTLFYKRNTKIYLQDCLLIFLSFHSVYALHYFCKGNFVKLFEAYLKEAYVSHMYGLVKFNPAYF